MVVASCRKILGRGLRLRTDRNGVKVHAGSIRQGSGDLVRGITEPHLRAWSSLPDKHLEKSGSTSKMATMAMADLWVVSAGGALEASFADSVQRAGQKTMAQTTGKPDNVKCLVAEESRLPGLRAVPKRSRGRRRRRESKLMSEKKTDSEFDLVIVPPDGCYMSDSDSYDSDWSVGWFEPHATDFTENDGEESFAVLVPSYVLPSPELKGNSAAQGEERDSGTPAWATLLANMSSHTSLESQKQLDLWLKSLTS